MKAPLPSSNATGAPFAKGQARQPAKAATPSQLRFQEIYRTIRRRIALHRYPPGTRLDINLLASEFEVSRTPLRSVMQRLGDDELVVNRHGVPTIVSALDFGKLRQVVVFRMRLAELIGELSPLTPSQETLGRLKEILARFDQLGAESDIAAFGGIDLDTHECVCTSIGNPHLLATYDRMFYITARMWVHFLPQLDWRREVEIFQSEVFNWSAAMNRGDARALGFLIRNSLSHILFRLSHLI